MLKLSVKHKDTVHTIDISESETFGSLKKELQKLSTSIFHSAKIPLMQQELSRKIGDEKKVFGDDSMPLKIGAITTGT